MLGKNNLMKLTLAALVAAPFSAAAVDSNDIRLLNEAKISLVEAIQTAEKHQGGKAIEASLDDDGATPSFEVSIIKDNRAYDVFVDTQTGKVINTREDD